MRFPIFLYLMIFLNPDLYAHNENEHQFEPKKWHVSSQTIDGFFLFYRKDSVFIENIDHQVVGYPFHIFSIKDQSNIRQRQHDINRLNRKLDQRHILNKQDVVSKSRWHFIDLYILVLLGICLLIPISQQKKKFIFPILIFSLSSFFLSITDPNIVNNAFLPFASDVHTFWDNNYFYVESKGIPNSHEMMVGISDHGWQQQVPIPQCYIGNNAWSIPLNPIMAANPLPVNQSHFTRGAIAIAVNGVPIFNPYTNTGVDALLDGQLDNYGGHCGKGDDYHYHTAPLHLYNQTNSTLPIAYAFDGFPVFGSLEPDGTSMASLDANHGHFFAGNYHYHGTPTAPYMIAQFAGEVTEDATFQLVPQAHANPVRTENWTPLNGALITSCQLNNLSNGYDVIYKLNGLPGYATKYSWNGSIYSFHYDTPTGSTQLNYNGFAPCDLPMSTTNFTEAPIRIFPNPFEDYLYLPENFLHNKCTLYQSNGKVVYSGKNISNQNFSSLAIGIYYLQIENRKSSIKLIKK